MRVFVVDDHRDIAEGLADVLRMQGHEVDIAFNGQQAVRMFQENDYDIAFMDVMMPGMNGVESFLAIRRTKPDAKVVMMTGYSVEQLLDQVVEKGAYGVLHKPVAIDAVLETLERLKSEGLVLIADANPQFCASIKGVLEQNGYRSVIANTGKEALAHAMTGGVDIMLLGQELPILSGLEVCMELRKRSRDIPTVIVTEQGKTYDANLDNLYNFTTTGILTKPFNTEQLLMALGQFQPSDQRAQDKLGSVIESAATQAPTPAAPASAGSIPDAAMPGAALPEAKSPTTILRQPPPAAPAIGEGTAPAPTPSATPSERPATVAPTPPPPAAPAMGEATTPTPSSATDTQPPRPEPVVQTPRPAPEAPPQRQRQGRILAVDDDVDMVDGLAEVLTSIGYEVETANNEEQAHEIIQEYDAQVALLDIRLGKTSGLDLIESLKEFRPNVQCIMITGNADRESAIAALRRGAYNYLTKPLHPEELFAILDTCLDKYVLDQKLREAFEELQIAKEEAEKKVRIVSGVYDEIGTSVDAMVKEIRQSTGSLLKDPGGSAGGQAHLDLARNIHTIAARIENAVGNAADLAKLKAFTLELNEAAVDIGQLVTSCADTAREAAADAGPEITVNVPNERIPVWGDQRLLKLVILNLLSNSADYTPADGKITLSVRRDTGGDPIVEVKDTGTGMPVDDIRKAIAGFGRNADARHGAGGSLDIVLVSNISRLHNAEVDFERLPEGGTVATMRLPAKRVISADGSADSAIAMAETA